MNQIVLGAIAGPPAPVLLVQPEDLFLSLQQVLPALDTVLESTSIRVTDTLLGALWREFGSTACRPGA